MRAFLPLLAGLIPVTFPSSPNVPSGADWSVPERFRGVTVVGRVRGFPERIVALTFDDGPDRANTPLVLDALMKHGAKATFFLIGEQVPANAGLVRRMVAEGHVVGNHSWSHPYRLSDGEGERQIARTEKTIEKIIGRKPACFRSPGGFTNNGIARAAHRRGLPNFLWMVSSADTTHIGSVAIARNVVSAVHPGDIVLMHDGPGHRATALAVPAILSGLAQKGFQCVTVPELCRAWDRWLTARGITKGIRATPPASATARCPHRVGRPPASERPPSVHRTPP